MLFRFYLLAEKTNELDQRSHEVKQEHEQFTNSEIEEAFAQS